MRDSDRTSGDEFYEMGRLWVGYPIGVLVAIIGWIYAMNEYGFFLGAGLGWIPALFLGILAAWCWPVIVLGILGTIGFFVYLAWFI